MNSIITTAVLFLLIGCGTEPTKKEEAAEKEKEVSAPHSLALQSKKDLPDCADENLNQLVYVLDEKQFYDCVDGNWNKINLSVEQKVEQQIVTQDSSALGGITWTDKITNVKWFVRGVSNGFDCSDTGTAGVQKFLGMPSRADIKTALRNGIFKGLNIRVFLESANSDIVAYSDFPDVELNLHTAGIARLAVTICPIASY